jgi:hypothetical protein
MFLATDDPILASADVPLSLALTTTAPSLR